MKFYNEYKTRGGLPFYSDWAFASDANKMYKANMEALAEYDGRYCSPNAGESLAECAKRNPDKLVYGIGVHGYGKNGYVVESNPENFSTEEIALIVDHGNLCFGFSGSPHRINIYTD